MRIANAIVAGAFISVFGSAHAEASLIPSNYVDDFGSLLPTGESVTTPSNAQASFIPSNYVDDFGNDFGDAKSAPTEGTATARADRPTSNSDSETSGS